MEKAVKFLIPDYIYKILLLEKKRTGITMSQLIRSAILDKYEQKEK